MRRSARSALPGGHLSRRHGESLEFAELRPYQPGDDLRTVDWHAYQRLRRLLVRRYRAEQSQDIYILLDGSGSMGIPSEKFSRARQIAGAAAVLATGEQDRLTLLPFREVVSGRFVESRRGRMPVDTLKALSQMVAAGRTSVAASLAQTAALMRRPGLVLVISDFFDPGDLEPPLRALGSRGAEILGVQVYSPQEEQPRLTGPVTLVDAESEAEHDLESDRSTRQAYLQLFSSYVAQLERTFRSAGAQLLRARSDTSLADTFFNLFSPGSSASETGPGSAPGENGPGGAR